MFYDDRADYKSFLPDIYQNVLEIDAVAKSVNIQIDELSARIKKEIVENHLVSEADEAGIYRWESILGVTTPLNSTLKARRDALLARLRSQPPINMKTLKNMIESYMGIEVDITVQNHVIQVRYRGESKVPDLTPLYQTLYETVPASLVVDIAYGWVTWGEIMAAGLTWGDLKKRTWDSIRRDAPSAVHEES